MTEHPIPEDLQEWYASETGQSFAEAAVTGKITPTPIALLIERIALLTVENAELKHSRDVFAKGLELEEAESDALHDEIDALTAERDSLQLRMDGAIAINQSAAAEIVELREHVAALGKEIK